MNDRVGPSEDSSVGLTKGAPNFPIKIDGKVSVELYEGPVKMFTDDKGFTHNFSDLCSKSVEEISQLFSTIHQGFESRSENIEQGFVEFFGLFLRPANLVQLVRKNNTVTTNGKNTVAAAMADETITVAPKNPTGIQVGLGSTAAAVGDTGVQTRAVDTADDFKIFLTTPTTYPDRTNNVVQWKSEFDANSCPSEALTEAVLCSAAHAGNGGSQGTSGDAISRIVFSTINKGTNDTLNIQFQWTFN